MLHAAKKNSSNYYDQQSIYFCLQLCGFSVSLAGLLLYRQYKTDPKKMILYCTSTALCTEAFAYCNEAFTAKYPDINNSNNIGSGSSINLQKRGGSPLSSPARNSNNNQHHQHQQHFTAFTEDDAEIQALMDEPEANNA